MSASKTTAKMAKRAGGLFNIFDLGTAGSAKNLKPTNRELEMMGVEPAEFNPSWR